MLSFRRGTFCSTNLQIKSNTPSSEIHREKLIFPRQMSKTILLRVNFSSLVKPSISPFACKIIQAKVYSSHLFPIFRIQTIEFKPFLHHLFPLLSHKTYQTNVNKDRDRGSTPSAFSPPPPIPLFQLTSQQSDYFYVRNRNNRTH